MLYLPSPEGIVGSTLLLEMRQGMLCIERRVTCALWHMLDSPEH